MLNLINVKEEHNVLSFDGEIISPVANSSNFNLKFTLDEEWTACSLITAVFSMSGKEVFVELDENYMCKIPPTDSSRIYFSLRATVNDSEFIASSILYLDVIPSGTANIDNVEFYKTAHQELMALINKLNSGDVKTKHSEISDKSLSQVSLTGDETISGTKNFTGSLKVKSFDVLTYETTPNPSILINGDFSINQRKQKKITRSTADIYTADRWLMHGAQGVLDLRISTFTPSEDGCYLSNYIEDSASLIGKQVTLSGMLNDTFYSGTFTLQAITEDADYYVVNTESLVFKLHANSTNSLFRVDISAPANTNVILGYVKLELGNLATKFVPRPATEELALCQRYFVQVDPSSSPIYTSTPGTLCYGFVTTPVPLRVAPTISVSGNPYIRGNGINSKFLTATTMTLRQNGIAVKYTLETSLAQDYIYCFSTYLLHLDAEIY